MTRESFLADVANHRMQVLRDEGVYRHLRFSRPAPNAWVQWFEIVTWPGALCLRGDMGTWVFSRDPDMFEFFRAPDQLRIKEDYWLEKLEAEDKRTGAEEFSREVFLSGLRDKLQEWDQFDGFPEDLQLAQDSLAQHLEHCNSHEELCAAMLEWDWNGDSFMTTGCYELPDGMVYTKQYEWCLWAIVWGIRQYDQHRENREAPDQEPPPWQS